ncbi:heat-inducible transcription repressor HrcA [bacterium]|nr:heat-inducible transcription repressor HrcA [bacterium]
MVRSKSEQEINHRKQHVLNHMIRGYIQSGVPVGSKWISETSGLDVSPATIRNDLGELERDGFLTQVHLSSGRIPTDKGYRAYVDQLGLNSPLQSETVDRMEGIQWVGRDVRSILSQVTELMGGLVDYTTIVVLPDVYRDTLKLAHLILVEIDVVLVVLMNSLGVNQEFLVRIQDKVNQDDLNRISKLLTDKLSGRPTTVLDPEMVSELAADLPNYRDILFKVTSEITQLKRHNAGSGRMLSKGFSNMIRLPEFRDLELTQKVLSVLEETKAMVSVMTEFLAHKNATVLIGEEQPIDQLKDTSLVVSPFSVDASPAGVIGVLGPRRMDYHRVIPIVESISNRVSEYLNSHS